MQTVLHRYIAKRSIHDDGTVFTIFANESGSFEVVGERSRRADDVGLYREGLLPAFHAEQKSAVAWFEKVIGLYLGRPWTIAECPVYYEACACRAGEPKRITEAK